MIILFLRYRPRNNTKNETHHQNSNATCVHKKILARNIKCKIENKLQKDIIILTSITTYSGFPCKAFLNRWRRIISSAMGYYETTIEIRIVWFLVPIREYQWCAIFIEKRPDWFTQATDNRFPLEIVVCASARKLQQLFAERVVSTLQF